MSFFDSLKDILTNTVIAQVAELTQEKPEQIQRAFDISAVGLVGSLIKRVSSETGMKLVHDQISNTTFDNNNLVGELKNTEHLTELALRGDKILNAILPNVKGPIIGLINRATSMRNSKSTTLCTLSMLLITSALRNQIKSKNLSPESLASYLGDQRKDLLEVSPADNVTVIEATNIGHLLNNFSVPQSTSSSVDTTSVAKVAAISDSNSYEETSTNYGAILKWIGGGLGIAALVAGGLYFWNNYQSTKTDSSADSTTLNQDAARVIVEPKPSVAELPDSKKADTAAVLPQTQVATAVTMSPIQAYLADSTKAKGRTVRFENVDFENNDIKTKPEASTSINDLIALLKKYPNAEVKFVVYADDAQLPLTNKMLSIKRAFALKNLMISGGISFVRIDTEGRGNGMEQKINPSSKPLREVYVKFVKK